jgi:hypothetical protein
MTTKHYAVFGIYPTLASFETAAEALKSGEFRSADVSVLFPENLNDLRRQEELDTHTRGGAQKGAQTGAFVGGMLGWLVGLGLLTIPGVGPFMAAGPIAAAIAGAGAGGAIGGIAGSLVGMGVPEHHAKRYEGHLQQGGILVSVHSDDMEVIERAKGILESTAAQDVLVSDEAHGHYPDDKPFSRSAQRGVL